MLHRWETLLGGRGGRQSQVDHRCLWRLSVQKRRSNLGPPEWILGSVLVVWERILGSYLPNDCPPPADPSAAGGNFLGLWCWRGLLLQCDREVSHLYVLSCYLLWACPALLQSELLGREERSSSHHLPHEWDWWVFWPRWESWSFHGDLPLRWTQARMAAGHSPNPGIRHLVTLPLPVHYSWISLPLSMPQQWEMRRPCSLCYPFPSCENYEMYEKHQDCSEIKTRCPSRVYHIF